MAAKTVDACLNRCYISTHSEIKKVFHMPKLEVFDPPMCCSSGVCGPKVDPALPRFAGDLEWVKMQGFAVARYNLAQQPMAFAENATVREALENEAVACLPLILVDGKIVSRGAYPTREALAGLLGAQPEVETSEVKSASSCCGCGASGKGSECCG